MVIHTVLEKTFTVTSRFKESVYTTLLDYVNAHVPVISMPRPIEDYIEIQLPDHGGHWISLKNYLVFILGETDRFLPFECTHPTPLRENAIPVPFPGAERDSEKFLNLISSLLLDRWGVPRAMTTSVLDFDEEVAADSKIPKFPEPDMYWAPERDAEYGRLVKLLTDFAFHNGPAPTKKDMNSWEWVASNEAQIIWYGIEEMMAH